MALRDASLLSHFDELCRGFNLWMNGDPLKGKFTQLFIHVRHRVNHSNF